MDVSVRKTRNGRGIHAVRHFAAGETLYEITGTPISGDADEDIDDTVRDNAFRFDENLYISPAGSVGDFQNHSCVPNAKVAKRDGRLYVAAIRSIARNEEVLIDYSTIIAADDIWEMACNCGADACRGLVRSFDRLPARLRKKYRADGVVPDYIVELSK